MAFAHDHLNKSLTIMYSQIYICFKSPSQRRGLLECHRSSISYKEISVADRREAVGAISAQSKGSVWEEQQLNCWS